MEQVLGHTKDLQGSGARAANHSNPVSLWGSRAGLQLLPVSVQGLNLCTLIVVLWPAALALWFPSVAQGVFPLRVRVASCCM